MIKYNNKIDELKLPLLKWSFRDIDKIIKRISEHMKTENIINYKNFKYYHFIYFYLFSSIPLETLNKEYKKKSLKNIIHQIFVDTFRLNKNISENLENSFI